MAGLVLDSFALIAYFEDEPAAGQVERALEQALRASRLKLTLVNWGEVYYSMHRTKGEDRAEECLLVMDELPIDLIPATREMTYEAARIKAKYRIAFGDCFAAALALQTQCPVLTGDREFKKLEKLVEIQWLPVR